jgi:hypothetical protein
MKLGIAIFDLEGRRRGGGILAPYEPTREEK